MSGSDDIDLNLLVALDALLQEGSVSRAARRLGLSTPALSHALGRLRARLEDPILVRAGREMAPTPRAEALRPLVREIVAQARAALKPSAPFVPEALDRTFVIRATDHLLSLLGLTLDRILGKEAPHVSLRFVPNAPDDAEALRTGEADLAIGIFDVLPPEMRTRVLLTDRYVCVVREGHPSVGDRLTLDQYAQLAHVQVAPRGIPGGYVDEELRAMGIERQIARVVPYFLIGLFLASETDYVLTISERLANEMAQRLRLRILEPPLELKPYSLSLVWHPRLDRDEPNRWLRDVLLRVAGQVAGERHPNARTRSPRKRR